MPDEQKNSEFQYLVIDDTKYETNLTKKTINRKKYVVPDKRKLNAFIPGIIRYIYIKEGQEIQLGDNILILEAMKMKNIVLSPRKGKITKIHVLPNEKVLKGQLLVEFE